MVLLGMVLFALGVLATYQSAAIVLAAAFVPIFMSALREFVGFLTEESK